LSATPVPRGTRVRRLHQPGRGALNRARDKGAIAIPLSPLECALPQIALLTPLESALMEVFILNSLKFFRMNTYKKHRGGGVVMVNQTPDQGCLSRTTIGRPGIPYISHAEICPACPEHLGEDPAAAEEPMEHSHLVGKDFTSFPKRGRTSPIPAPAPVTNRHLYSVLFLLGFCGLALWHRHGHRRRCSRRKLFLHRLRNLVRVFYQHGHLPDLRFRQLPLESGHP